jgi:hypothetical protein
MTTSTNPARTLAQAMAQLPLIAILRGLTPAEAKPAAKRVRKPAAKRSSKPAAR